LTEPRPSVAVLDTQIVLDLLHFADPRTAELSVAILHGNLRCFCDRRCFGEFERVLAYPQFALDTDSRQALLVRYRALTTFCEAPDDETEVLPRCRDADDQKFLQLAVRCRAELLITRDRKLLRLSGDRRLPFAIVDAPQAASRLAACGRAYHGSP